MVLKFIFFLLLCQNGVIFMFSIRENDSCSKTLPSELGCWSELIGSSNNGLRKPKFQNINCIYGFRKITCDLSLAQLHSDAREKLKEVVNYLTETNYCCWSELSFFNAPDIPTGVFSSKNTSSSIFLSNKINIYFKNVDVINSFAFSAMNLQSGQNISIKIDSFEAKSNIGSFKSNAFCFMNAKTLTFQNFLNSMYTETLNLDASMFFNSKIEEIVIKDSIFYGFTYKTKKEDSETFGRVNEILLDNCLIRVLDEDKLGRFSNVTKLTITNTGIQNFTRNTFSFLGKNLTILNLSKNLISQIYTDDLRYLSGLRYLSLAENPLKKIEANSLEDLNSSLQNIDLQKTLVQNLASFLPKSNNLIEINLSHNPYLSSLDVDFVLENSHKLNYLDISHTKAISAGYLNQFLDELNLNTNLNGQLKYLDVTSESAHLSDKIFSSFYEKQGNCLWFNLLKHTFIRVDENHACNCALVYLYNNLFTYEYPTQVLAENLAHNFTKYTNDKTMWFFISTLVPKCYRKLMYDINSLYELKQSCGIKPDRPENCTITTTTPVVTTAGITVTMEPADDPTIRLIDLYKSLTVMGTIIGIILLAVLLIIAKQYYDHKRRFLKQSLTMGVLNRNYQSTVRMRSFRRADTTTSILTNYSDYRY